MAGPRGDAWSHGHAGVTAAADPVPAGGRQAEDRAPAEPDHRWIPPGEHRGALLAPGAHGRGARGARDAGDLFLYSDAAAQARQEEAERAAAARIFALLPPAQAAGLRALWEEFEERRTADARFARALDRLQPMLLNMQTEGGTWVEHGVTLDQVLSKVDLIEEGSASLGAYARTMIATAVERGFLLPGTPAARLAETPAG